MRDPKKMVVRPEGIEPPTKSLEGSCSIRLSYERTQAAAHNP